MRGGNANRDIQEYGVLEAYKRALQHDNYDLAEAIVQANPQVQKEKFTAVFESLHATGEDDYGQTQP